MTDSAESRIGRLEQKLAALERDLLNVGRDVEALDKAREAVIRIEEQIRQIRAEITGLRESIAEDRAAAKAMNVALTEKLEEMTKAAAEDARDARRTLRNGMWGIASALVLAAGGIIAAGGHP